MIRVAIVEDDAAEREKIQGYLIELSRQEQIHYEIAPSPSGLNFIMGEMKGFDIVLMDIDMPGVNGMETAQALRKVDPTVILIFVTNMAQYAIMGYEVDALDYVLKPVSYGAFCTKLSRAIQRVQRRKGGQVALQLSGGGMQLLDTGDILYLETRNRMLYYHTATQEYAVRGSLAGAEKQLAAYHFARCNQCYLVNLQYVRGVENDFVQVGDARLEISRRQKAAFMTAVASYLGGEL